MSATGTGPLTLASSSNGRIRHLKQQVHSQRVLYDNPDEQQLDDEVYRRNVLSQRHDAGLAAVVKENSNHQGVPDDLAVREVMNAAMVSQRTG